MRRRHGRQIIVEIEELDLSLYCSRIAIENDARRNDRSRWESGNRRAGTEPDVSGDDAGAGVGDGRAAENSEAR